MKQFGASIDNIDVLDVTEIYSQLKPSIGPPPTGWIYIKIDQTK